MPDRYDLVVVGAGATGLGAARAARSDGRTVALVESARPGGDCTHYGCVPSKTLIEIARRVHGVRAVADAGVRATVEVDMAGVMARVKAVIAEIEGDESPALLARQGIDLVAGHAVLGADRSVAVDGRRLLAQKVLLATGGGPSVPPIPGLDAVPYLTNRTVFDLTETPAHLLVLGGGPIGCELAQAFRRLGSEVTILEAADRLIGKDEPEAARVLARVLTAEGVTIRTGAAVERVSSSDHTATSGPVLHLGDGSTVAGSHLLVAVGRLPHTDGMGLTEAGVRLDDRGRIVTDEHLATTLDGVYAAGDCTAQLQFTHVGDAQGRLAAANAFAPPRRPGFAGGAKPWDDRVIPWVTYTEPEIAHVGLTEAQAYAQHGDHARVAYLPMASTDRPRTAGETEGFVKMIAAPRTVLRSKLLMPLVGMTVVAATGGELIAEGALAMQTNMLVGRIAQTIHAYPTWSMATRLAAAQFFGTYGGRTARPARADRG